MCSVVHGCVIALKEILHPDQFTRARLYLWHILRYNRNMLQVVVFKHERLHSESPDPCQKSSPQVNTQ
jgi:hypothetical protein